MQVCQKMEYEYQLEAELIYEFSRHGCRSVAYDPIVGGGANAAFFIIQKITNLCAVAIWCSLMQGANMVVMPQILPELSR